MDRRRPGRTCIILSATAALLLTFALALPAHAGMEEEAERQLQLAEEDLEAGNCERAAASAASAQRADPSRHEAFVVRALALQCLGDLEDAAALLRAYKVLRGKLPLDERVEPALAEIERQLGGDDASEEEEQQVLAGSIDGPVAVLYGPGSDERAAERAYEAARPFLGGRPAQAVVGLDSALADPEDVVVLGVDAVRCDSDALTRSLVASLQAAELAISEVDVETAEREATVAENHLICSREQADPEMLARLLAVRGQARWEAGEPELASRLWQEMFTVSPGRSIDLKLPPSAQALQLDAKSRAEDPNPPGRVISVVPKGWTVRLDGRRTTPEAAVRAGRRLVELVGPRGEEAGFVLPVEQQQVVLVGTPDALRDAFYAEGAPGMVMVWAGQKLAPVLDAQKAEKALVVNLDVSPPTSRLFDGERFLAITPSGKGRPAASARVEKAGKGPHPASAVLVGGGLAAAAAGVVVTVLAQQEGESLRGTMDTLEGYHEGFSAYETARMQEQVGLGVAIGGGVLATVGGITFAIPQPGTKSKETAAR